MTKQVKMYIGKKIITAWPESNESGDAGYGVRYEDGYTSWSPKAVFDEAYIDIGDVSHLAPHQQRVVAERAELDDRIGKLRKFLEITSETSLDHAERKRMIDQLKAMQDYSLMLTRRIVAF